MYFIRAFFGGFLFFSCTVSMLSSIKSAARKSPFILKTHKIFKKILIFPFTLTDLNVLQPEKIPFRDFFNPKKLNLLKTVRPYTKNGFSRLTNVYDLAREIEQKNIPGAFVECGVWKGGLCAVMGAVAHDFGDRRTTWYLDSFEGMPEVASSHDGEGTEEIAGDVLKASVADAEEIVFGKLGLSREKNKIIKGWFEETLPQVKSEIGQIAILRLDADWYEATKLILDELYDQVVPGGYLIFDDYGRWIGSRKAVDDFLTSRNISPKLQFIGSVDGPKGEKRLAPMYFKKP